MAPKFLLCGFQILYPGSSPLYEYYHILRGYGFDSYWNQKKCVLPKQLNIFRGFEPGFWSHTKYESSLQSDLPMRRLQSLLLGNQGQNPGFLNPHSDLVLLCPENQFISISTSIPSDRPTAFIALMQYLSKPSKPSLRFKHFMISIMVKSTQFPSRHSSQHPAPQDSCKVTLLQSSDWHNIVNQLYSMLRMHVYKDSSTMILFNSCFD